MSKRKRQPKIQSKKEQLHPLIERTNHSDVMSNRTEFRITIPPDIGWRNGGEFQKSFLEALAGGALNADTPLNSWSDIKEITGFHELEAAETQRLKQEGHQGPVQLPERFSEEALRRDVYLLIKQALDAISGFSSEDKNVVLNKVAARFLKAGMALKEAQLRREHLTNVDVGSKVRAGAEKEPRRKRGTTKDKTRRVLDKMDEYIARGNNVSGAAYLAHVVDKLGASEDANRQAYYRREKKRVT
ncbi:hypothetical protein PhaeoP30_00466 [Phaeobacter inhibens]|uniref:hypothetical protein n=1 Tax=Phaeobacter inhibens TaxID=221822 RepID=UPI000C9B61F6|nr:hypothetical protein [Phaeobacter inhibens]AUQ57409.1 hypothetical protein PhaeoP30_00466 [Phaeobacter inhibens]